MTFTGLGSKTSHSGVADLQLHLLEIAGTGPLTASVGTTYQICVDPASCIIIIVVPQRQRKLCIPTSHAIMASTSGTVNPLDKLIFSIAGSDAHSLVVSWHLLPLNF